MVATLPFVLLLLDVWPLARWRLDDGFWDSARSLALEKLPLFALAAVSMGLTLSAQQQIGAVAAFETLPLRIRLSNAAVSYLAYLGKTIWPAGLVPFYPYRESAAGRESSPPAVAGLVALTAAAIVVVRRAPYVTVGWLWYVGTLVPVIGIVQIGGHAMADRFTYIPLIGIFILIAWAGAAIADASQATRCRRGMHGRAHRCRLRGSAHEPRCSTGGTVSPSGSTRRASRPTTPGRMRISAWRSRATGSAARRLPSTRKRCGSILGCAETHNNLALALVDEHSNRRTHSRTTRRLSG